MAETKTDTVAEKPALSVTVIGTPGQPFTIRDGGFGETKGMLTVGGFGAPISTWRDDVIKGQLPTGVKGEVVLTTANGVRRGVFPPSRKT